MTTVLAGPTAVAYGRMAALKGALKLESLGMKTRGGALRPRLAKEFGLPARADYSSYIAVCLAKMDEYLEIRRQELAPPTVELENGQEIYL